MFPVCHEKKKEMLDMNILGEFNITTEKDINKLTEL